MAAVLAVVLYGAGSALAQSSGKTHGMTEGDVTSKLEAAGYSNVHGVEREGKHFDADATTKDGKPIHLHVDPGTGKITAVAHESEREEAKEGRHYP
ncbi:MAG: PepSY domain-containing protein [Lysobacter sp.]|nr:PepSY domain-containing protein [Lysobacter sp.]